MPFELLFMGLFVCVALYKNDVKHRYLVWHGNSKYGNDTVRIYICR